MSVTEENAEEASASEIDCLSAPTLSTDHLPSDSLVSASVPCFDQTSAPEHLSYQLEQAYTASAPSAPVFEHISAPSAPQFNAEEELDSPGSSLEDFYMKHQGKF